MDYGKDVLLVLEREGGGQGFVIVYRFVSTVSFYRDISSRRFRRFGEISHAFSHFLMEYTPVKWLENVGTVTLENGTDRAIP